MNAGGRRVDTNHINKVAEATKHHIDKGGQDTPTTSISGSHGDIQKQRNRTQEEHQTRGEKTSSVSIDSPVTALGKKGAVFKATSHDPISKHDLIEGPTPSVANRINQLYSNQVPRDDGNGRPPVCLATRSPKTKPKTFTLAKPSTPGPGTGESAPGKMKSAGERQTCEFGNGKKARTLTERNVCLELEDRKGNSGDNVERPGGHIGIKSQVPELSVEGRTSLSMAGNNDISDVSQPVVVVCGNKDDGAVMSIETKMEKKGDKSSPQRENQDAPKGETTLKIGLHDKRDSLIRQKGATSRSVVDGKSCRSDDATDMSCPPLPASLSRDSGISSPSVDEAKSIDHREEPKDNETKSRDQRFEKRKNREVHGREIDSTIHVMRRGGREGKETEEENTTTTSAAVNNPDTSMRSVLDSSQTRDRTVCSETHLSNNLPCTTLAKNEPVSRCQGEANPDLLSPHYSACHPVNASRETGIEYSDKHALSESEPPLAGSSNDQTASSGNSPPVGSSAVRSPKRLEERDPSTCRIDEVCDSTLCPDGLVSEGQKTGCIDSQATSTERLKSVSINPLSSDKRQSSPDSNLSHCVVDYQVDLSTEETLNSTSVSEVLESESTGQSTKETSLEAIIAVIAITETTSLSTATTTSEPSSSTGTSTTSVTTSATRVSSSVSETFPSPFVTKEYNSDSQTVCEIGSKSLHHCDQKLDYRIPSESLGKEDKLQENKQNQEQKYDQEPFPQQQKDPSGSNSSTVLKHKENVDGVNSNGCENGHCHQTQVSVDIETGTLPGDHIVQVDAEPIQVITVSPQPGVAIDVVEGHDLSSGNKTCQELRPFKPKRPKLAFKDINIQEVISLQSDSSGQSKLKSILKSKSADSLNGAGTPTTSACDNGRDKLNASRTVSFKKTHTKNTFSYYNAAFEGEMKEEPSRRPSLADVVSHIMRANSVVDVEEEDDNSHPYGRDNSLTDLINGKRRGTYNMDAGKMIVWFALAIMIVSLAGVIIFMSESYNLTHEEEIIYFPADDTTLSHS